MLFSDLFRFCWVIFSAVAWDLIVNLCGKLANDINETVNKLL